MNRISALVMLSGGLDSAVALYWALRKGYSVKTLMFDYYRRSKREVGAAMKLSKASGCLNQRVDLNFLKEVEDARKENKNTCLLKAPSSYIPARNVIFYGIAVSLAETGDYKYVVGGHNKDDASSFPDSSINFFKKFNQLTSIGLYSKRRTGRVIMPLASLRKWQVIKLGRKLGVPFELTWSCYFESKHPCGKCLACRLRMSAFERAGTKDPL